MSRLRIISTDGIAHPRTRDFWRRFTIEDKRRRGKFRELVVEQLRSNVHPDRKDLAAALCEPPPDVREPMGVQLTLKEADEASHSGDPMQWAMEHVSPERRANALQRLRASIAADTATLCHYTAQYFVDPDGPPRRSGAKGPRMTIAREMKIVGDYFAAVRQHQEATDGARDLRPVKKRIARKHRISVDTLKNLIRGRRAIIR